MHGIIVPMQCLLLVLLSVFWEHRLGFPILDPLASVAICVLIVKASVEIFKDAVDKMVDHSCDEATEESMRESDLGSKRSKRN